MSWSQAVKKRKSKGSLKSTIMHSRVIFHQMEASIVLKSPKMVSYKLTVSIEGN